MIAKMKGTFSERPKKPKRVMPAQAAQEDAAEAKKMKRKAAKEQARVYQQQSAPAPVVPVPQPLPIQMGWFRFFISSIAPQFRRFPIICLPQNQP